MVDTIPPAEQEIDQAVEVEKPARSSFFASTNGKIAIAVVSVFMLLIVAGVALFFFFIQAPQVDLAPAPSAPVTGGQGQEAAVEPVEPADQPLSSTFVFRNIFKPSVKAPAPPTQSSSSGTDGDSTGSGTTAGSNELLLVSVQTTDGERTATFSWNGETYVLAKGDTIPGTPWKVVDISSNSASVIYGDSSPIELTVGSSVSK